MRRNRSIPPTTIIPELAYADVPAAAEWLCRAFGFTVRLRIADHRIQLNAGEGAIVVVEAAGGRGTRSSVMMRIDNAFSHHAHALANGARILDPPTDYPYGERQYAAEDCGGHRWKFSETIADVAPEEWGGQSENL